MAETPTCPTTAELQRFANRELQQTLTHRIDEHLKVCRHCAESLSAWHPMIRWRR